MFTTFSALVAAVILAIAAVGKLSKPRQLAGVIQPYGLVPRSFAMPVAVTLVLGEAVLVVLLPSGFAGWIAYGLAAALFLAFAAVTALMRRHGNGVPCGCLGPGPDLRLGALSIGLNLALAVALAVSAGLVASGFQAGGVAFSGVLRTSAISIACLYWLTLYAASVIKAVNERLATGGGAA
ncbi:MAG: hypothetical protein MSC30_11105 [Gaiellaceae bacterium MAG52_C11]|nr:hypothetical protein [Candidatus Gaiellasilicea maunaloa]